MLRPTVVISVVLYGVGFLLGLTLPHLSLMSIDIQNDKVLFKIQFLDIFKNNFKVVLLLLSGSFLFGTTTILNLIFNGAATSLIIRDSFLAKTDPSLVLLLTVPHGIFEIPAIIIAGAAGFKIPYEIIGYLAGRKEQILTKEDIKEYLILALISIILIVIAAWIEAYVTPRIAEFFLR